MKTPVSVVAAIGVAALLAAGACSSNTVHSTAFPTATAIGTVAPNVHIAPTATYVSPTSPPISKPTSSLPPTSTPTEKSGSSAAVKCSVTNDTLFAVLRADASLYQRAGSPVSLETPACVPGFAVAKGSSDYVLFREDAATQTWTAVNVGSSDFCKGYVPADLSTSLPGCGG